MIETTFIHRDVTWSHYEDPEKIKHKRDEMKRNGCLKKKENPQILASCSVSPGPGEKVSDLLHLCYRAHSITPI